MFVSISYSKQVIKIHIRKIEYEKLNFDVLIR